MYKNKRFLAVIPARGGSKGIPKKNIYHVMEKPLIAYTIEAAKQSKYIDRIIVSTDDEKIAQISRDYGAEVPFLRPSELATDEAKTIDTVLHVIATLEETYDCVITLQPTQPLRTAVHIDQAIEVFSDQNYSSIVSVSPVIEHPILMRTIDQNGRLYPLIHMNSTVRRQDFSPFYRVDGAIYINCIATLTNETSLNDNEFAFEIQSEMIDIDIFDDLVKFENRLRKDLESQKEKTNGIS